MQALSIRCSLYAVAGEGIASCGRKSGFVLFQRVNELWEAGSTKRFRGQLRWLCADPYAANAALMDSEVV